MLQVHLWVFTARKRSLGQGIVFTGLCLSTGGGGAWSCGVEGVPAPGRGACSGGVPAPGGGWVPALGSLVWGCLVETPPTATAMGSTHPTGMHSCFCIGSLV